MSVPNLLLVLAFFIASPALSGGEPFLGPRPNDLFGYWPLGYVDLTDQKPYYFTDYEEVGASFHSERHLVIETGPYNQPKMSLSKTKDKDPFPLLQIGQAKLPTSFTIAFYLRPVQLWGNASGGSIFVVSKRTSNAPAFGIYYHPAGHLYVSCSALSSWLPQDSVHYGKWAFFAVTFDWKPETSDTTLTIYDEAGRTVKEVSTKAEKLWDRSDPISIDVGHFETGDRLSCLLIYKTVLSPNEIANLPCVCESRARCTGDGKSNRKRGYRGPKSESLIGYWPLVDKVSELDEMTKAKFPVEINATIFQVRGSPNDGPIKKNRRLFTSASDGQPVAKFKNIFPIPTGDFSITAFIYDPNDFAINDPNERTFLKWGDVNVTVPDGGFVGVESGWNFLAFVYDKSSRNGTFFDGKGGVIVILASTDMNFGKILEIGFRKKEMAIACLSIHNAALAPQDIKQMRGECERSVSFKAS